MDVEREIIARAGFADPNLLMHERVHGGEADMLVLPQAWYVDKRREKVWIPDFWGVFPGRRARRG